MSEPKEALQSFFDFNISEMKKSKDECSKTQKEVKKISKKATDQADKMSKLLDKLTLDRYQEFIAEMMNSLKSLDIGIRVLLIMMSLELMASIWSTLTIYDLWAL